MKLCILAVGPPLSDIHRLPNCNENKPQTLHAERPGWVNPLASLISHPQPLPTVVWPHWPLSCSLNRRSSCQAEACVVTCVRTLLPTEGTPEVPEVPEPPNSPGPCPACSPSQHLMLHRTISIGWLLPFSPTRLWAPWRQDLPGSCSLLSPPNLERY